MQLKRSDLLISLAILFFALLAIFTLPLAEITLRMSGVDVRGLRVRPWGTVAFDSYEDRSASRIVRVRGFEMRLRKEDGRLEIDGLKADEIVFEDLATPVVELGKELTKLREIHPSSAGRILVRNLRIGKLSFTPSASSTAIELSEVTARNLEIGSDGARVDEFSAGGPFANVLDDGSVLRGTLNFPPEIFADLRKEWRWTFEVPKSRLALTAEQLSDLRSRAERYSQP